jgi:hypothetical protein
LIILQFPPANNPGMLAYQAHLEGVFGNTPRGLHRSHI